MRSAGSAARSMKNNTNVASAAITTDPAVNAAKTVSPEKDDERRDRRESRSGAPAASQPLSEVDRRDVVSPRHTGRSPREAVSGHARSTGGIRRAAPNRNGKMKIGATHVRKPIETMTSMTASTTLAVICS